MDTEGPSSVSNEYYRYKQREEGHVSDQTDAFSLVIEEK